jgi:hypothetical protein
MNIRSKVVGPFLGGTKLPYRLQQQKIQGSLCCNSIMAFQIILLQDFPCCGVNFENCVLGVIRFSQEICLLCREYCN